MTVIVTGARSVAAAAVTVAGWWGSGLSDPCVGWQWDDVAPVDSTTVGSLCAHPVAGVEIGEPLCGVGRDGGKWGGDRSPVDRGERDAGRIVGVRAGDGQLATMHSPVMGRTDGDEVPGLAGAAMRVVLDVMKMHDA